MKLLFPFAKRFIAGYDFASAIPVIQKLMDDGYQVSVDYLGELSKTEEDCERAYQQYLEIVDYYKNSKIDISIKPSQLGLKINKKKLIALVQENYRPEKRKYQYEFFYDNCSSRIRDILFKSIGDELKWSKHLDANKYTYRQIIHQYLKYDPWLELGIDLVLGSKIDVVVDNQSLMFLPDYLESIIDQSTITKDNAIKAKNLVGLKQPIIVSGKKTRETYNISIYAWLSLLITFSLLILKKEKLFNIWTSTNLLLTGILGVLLVFMWWATDHSGTKYNLNLLWASPFNLLLIGVIIFKKWNKFSFIYIIITGILLFSTILFWFTMAQELNPFVKPIIISLCLMYYYYFRKNKILINLPQTKD